jgi:hypothetical protein
MDEAASEVVTTLASEFPRSGAAVTAVMRSVSHGAFRSALAGTMAWPVALRCDAVEMVGGV